MRELARQRVNYFFIKYSFCHPCSWSNILDKAGLIWKKKKIISFLLIQRQNSAEHQKNVDCWRVQLPHSTIKERKKKKNRSTEIHYPIYGPPRKRSILQTTAMRNKIIQPINKWLLGGVGKSSLSSPHHLFQNHNLW